MNSVLVRKWVSSTLIKPRKTSVTPCKVQQSTLPPEPIIASKKPLKVDLVGGKRYSWCTCGYSKKQPFCDGAHKTKTPGLFPLRFVPEKDTTVWLCGCKYTNNPPYCDGTHKQDFIKNATLQEQIDREWLCSNQDPDTLAGWRLRGVLQSVYSSKVTLKKHSI